MPSKRVLVVWNTVSGLNTQKSDREILSSFLEEKNCDYEIRDWSNPHQIPVWVAEAEKNHTDLLFSAGGDGTALAIAEQLIRMKSSIPLAVIPLGTSNMLALSLGLHGEMDEVLRSLWEGIAVRIDAGYAREKDRYYLVGASIGAHAELIRRTPRMLKRLIGVSAYILAGIRTMIGRRSANVRIETDLGNWRWKTDSIEVFNTTGFLHSEQALLPRVDPMDGKLDLMALRAGSLVDLAGLLLYGLFGMRFKPWYTEHRQIERVFINPTKPMEVQLDGESIGHTPVTIEVRKKALSVVVPSPLKSRQLQHQEETLQ